MGQVLGLQFRVPVQQLVSIDVFTGTAQASQVECDCNYNLN